MPSRRMLSWFHRLIWTVIYGGLMVLLLGISVARSDDATGWWLMAVGGVIAVAGLAMIYLRSRMKETRT